MDIYSTQDLMGKLSDADAGEATWQVMQEHFNNLGFDGLIFGIMNKQDHSIRGLFTNVSVDYMEEYVAEGYGAHDPFAAYTAMRSADFLYTDQTEHMLADSKNPIVQTLLRRGAENGLRTTVLSPFHHSHEHYKVAFNLGTGMESEAFLAFWEDRKEEILLGTALAQSYTSKLLIDRKYSDSWTPINDVGVKLTPRELEALNWLANGLRVDRIAEKMNIANVTVNLHIQSIKAKLNAKTREHAVAIAFLENIIR